MPQFSAAQLANMRQVMAQNPAMAQALIQQIAATNPGLLQHLGANPEQAIADVLQSAADGQEDDDEDPVPPGAQVVSVTVEERDAIERVSMSTLNNPILQMLLNDSCKPLDFPGSSLSKLTLRAIRTRRWRPTFSLTKGIWINS